MNFTGLTAKQKDYLRNGHRRWNILTGATRSGKTVGTFFMLPLRIKEHYNDRILFIGKTLNTIDRNIFDPLRELYGYDNIGKIVGNREITMFGKKCYVVGANDDRAITKIQGVGIGYAYGDELTTWTENFFQMLKSRLDLPNSKFDGTCNPESPSHFIKKHLDNKELDIYQSHFTIYDNPFLSPEFVRNLENEYRNTIYFDKWILGKWVANEGLVYPLFRRERHFMTPAEFSAKFGRLLIKYVIWGGDGATTNDSTAIIPLAILENGMGVTLEPFYHNPQTNGPLSNAQLMPYIEEYLAEMEDKYHFDSNGVLHYMPIDCAAADLVLTLSYNLGEKYNVAAYTKKNIQLTTDVVNNAFGRNALYILNYGGYYNYIRHRFERVEHPLVIDLESMVWDKHNKGYDDSVPNDCADAFRYAVNTYYANPDSLWETPNAEEYYKIGD